MTQAVLQEGIGGRDHFTIKSSLWHVNLHIPIRKINISSAVAVYPTLVIGKIVHSDSFI